MPVASYWPLPPVPLGAPGPRAPALSEDDFLRALQDLLPRGRAWPRDEDTNLTALLRGLAKSQAAAHARQLELLTDAFPATTYELLPEWEASLGLPDPCAGEQPLISERQAQVVARLAFAGGQSVGYFTAYALQLGYAVTITEFAERRYGQPYGTDYGGPAWSHHWRVNAPSFTVRERLYGDAYGGLYADWGNTVLQCELARLKPGQTTLEFSYS